MMSIGSTPLSINLKKYRRVRPPHSRRKKAQTICPPQTTPKKPQSAKFSSSFLWRYQAKNRCFSPYNRLFCMRLKYNKIIKNKLKQKLS
jgi:hypothetical protein